jgi:hypothetical protein
MNRSRSEPGVPQADLAVMKELWQNGMAEKVKEE